MGFPAAGTLPAAPRGEHVSMNRRRGIPCSDRALADCRLLKVGDSEVTDCLLFLGLLLAHRYDGLLGFPEPWLTMKCRHCSDFGVIWECSRNKDNMPTSLVSCRQQLAEKWESALSGNDYSRLSDACRLPRLMARNQVNRRDKSGLDLCSTGNPSLAPLQHDARTMVLVGRYCLSLIQGDPRGIGSSCHR